MPRAARAKAASGIYHVIFRGIGRQRIFEEDEDGERFLALLAANRDRFRFEIIGYCLMGNHAHLLLRFDSLGPAHPLQRVASEYASWFNMKYDRTGHLFQDRYKSEPVESDRYLLTALRYIHLNPVKAGLCARPEEYEPSSYGDYMGRPGIVDTAMVLDMMSVEQIEEYTNRPNDDTCLEVGDRPQPRFTDDDARRIILQVCGCGSAEGFQALSEAEQDLSVKEIVAAGVCIRQCSRLTGMSAGKIRRRALTG